MKDERSSDLVRALGALHRAQSLDPTFPEARFNRALVLGHLHLRDQARQAWQDYLELDPISPWAGEARVRLRELGSRSLANMWREERPRLEAAVERRDFARVEEVVRRLPNRARVAVEEEALGLWGAAVEAGDTQEARRQLAFSRALGSALERVTGDAMVADAVAVIDRAVHEGPPSELERLAAGHSAFGGGLSLYRNQEGEAALPYLADAARLLREAGSPFAGWAEFYATACTHYADATEALAVFRRLETATDPDRYRVLGGFQSWMAGTVSNYLNRPEDALAAYGIARRRLASAGSQPETHGFLHVLFAETYEILGERDVAWRERLSALAAAANGGDTRRRHSTLYEAASAAARIAPAAAVDFVEEALQNAEAWGNAGALVEAYSLAGRTYAAVGRHEEALAAFDASRGHAARVGQGEQTEKIAMEAALVEGEMLVELDPRSAVKRLSTALETARRRSFLGFDHRMLAARARAWSALGDPDSAEEDLQRALALYEGVREELQSESLRLSYFEGAQDAFDAMIHLQAADRRSPSAAFTYAERARARLLLDMVEEQPGSAELPLPVDAAEVARRLPENTILVEYAVLPDRLLAWAFHGGIVEMHSFPRSSPELEREVSALRSAIERRADAAEVRAAAGALYETLLHPVLDGLPEGAPLVVVPDRFLSLVPFPVLVDRRRGRYLIEDRAVAVAPSATVYVTARERALEFRGLRTVLAVGDPAFDRAAHPTLPRLPGAAEEAAEVAGLYAGSELLRFERATPEAVVEAAAAHRILHLSGHALLAPGSPWNHRLVLAPGARGGSLVAREIAALILPEIELVVLSACRTLPGGPERESFHGLAAAFLAAGAPVVVSSLWEIEDRAARSLMNRFHRALVEGAAPADALRQAQLHLLRQSDPALASPAAWGAFEVFGGAIAH